MELSNFGKAIGNKSRVKILMALLGGKALPAGELAYQATISNATASEHLGELARLGFIERRKCGRFQYFEISCPEVAGLIEDLASKLPEAFPRPRRDQVPNQLKRARLCYDHLAGELGVEIAQRLIKAEVIRLEKNEFVILQDNHPFFESLNLNLQEIKLSRRKVSPRCVDWSERVPHIGGALGAAMAQKFFEKKFLIRSREDRSVALTPLGTRFLNEVIPIFDTTKDLPTCMRTTG